MCNTSMRSSSTVVAATLAVFVSSIAAAAGFEVFVTNERSGDVTVIDGMSFK